MPACSLCREEAALAHARDRWAAAREIALALLLAHARPRAPAGAHAANQGRGRLPHLQQPLRRAFGI